MIWTLIISMTLAYCFLMTLQVMASWGKAHLNGGAQVLVFLAATIVSLFFLGAIPL